MYVFKLNKIGLAVATICHYVLLSVALLLSVRTVVRMLRHQKQIPLVCKNTWPIKLILKLV